jgi:predicted ATPase
MTTTGARTISRWITSWASPVTILERQEAVQELQPHRAWRMRFFEVACGLRDQRTSPEAIVLWVESDDHFATKRWLVPFTWIGPLLFWGGLVGLSIALTGENNLIQMICLGCLLAGLAFNFLLSLFIIGPIHDLFHRIGAANCELQILRTWIQTAREMPHASAFNSRIHHALFDKESDADAAIGKLQGWMFLAGFQRSPLFFLPYLFLQFTTLWDIRILSGLEKWKSTFGKHARSWIDSLGMLDAITSASAIADEHPTWAYPKILDRGALLSTDGMSHPLLKDKQRVPNNLTIDEERRLLLVTGSNMAGKSTLLRSVGVNSVLARLGSPVCADSWVGESFDIASSIRVQDSLQDGVSFFMAELKRLRSVVDQAIAESKPDGKRMIILLDEILQGTNSRERQIAVDSVLRRLVDLGCIVLASTHDLELASNDKMQVHAQIVHFREHFEMVDGKQIMRFDYIMRSGVTPTTNALKLLELVGL